MRGDTDLVHAHHEQLELLVLLGDGAIGDDFQAEVGGEAEVVVEEADDDHEDALVDRKNGEPGGEEALCEGLVPLVVVAIRERDQDGGREGEEEQEANQQDSSSVFIGNEGGELKVGGLQA